jgi:NAD(P)-dependent dehydrogenase (short-subunit alcohol dehydrogenase family)
MTSLTNKVAAVFAASGAIGGAVAKALAAKGATVYVSTRSREAAQKLADEIKSTGGIAHPAQVDAMNEAEIDQHLAAIVKKHNRLDIVFNGIGVRPLQSGYGTPSITLSFEQFMLPITTHVGSQFLTARTAARYMMQTKSAGTILMLTASLSRLKLPFMAGITAACTGIEGLTRVLAAEFAQASIKVICINPTAMSETRTIQETSIANAKTMGVSIEEFTDMQSRSASLLGKGLTLHDMAEAAAFLVSDAGAVLNSHVVDVDFGNMSVI